MKKLSVAALVSGALLFASAAQAAGPCYTPAEFEADHGLRMHSDTEVIMLTCRYSTTGEDLKKSYTTFLQKNSKLIHDWEQVIAKKFANTGRSRNEVIDNFRTKLANQKANQSSQMGARPFCKAWSDFLPWAAKLTNAEVLEYARDTDAARPTKLEPCDK